MVPDMILFLPGCTWMDADRINVEEYPISYLCIRYNPKVRVEDFLDVVTYTLNNEYGIATEIYKDTIPDECEYILTYTARRSWDIVPYLSYAWIKINKDKKLVGSATYEHIGGSLSWAPTK
ncbi:hypothetical protein [Thiolapillus sp.]|uniref:hypothetical protein n=1 Tax=Thiolapillus sp. TaxID=2017437 RepID=UPI003AF73F9E